MATYDRRKLVFFSPVQQALNLEITSHPKLMEHLEKHPAAEFEVRLAEIARFCGIALDGEYNSVDIDVICGMCLEELKKRSTLILTI